MHHILSTKSVMVMDTNSQSNDGKNARPELKVRPKSSMLPPLVRRSPEQDFPRRRSSSFDYSFSNSKLELYSNKSSKSQTNYKKSDEVFVQQKESSPGPLFDVIPVLPKTPIDECQRLRNENQILKNNFLRMSRIIQKHSRLMAKKDEIILKLQEKNSRNNFPGIPNDVCRSQNVPDHLLYKQYFNTTVETTEEIQSKSFEFSIKFQQIYDSMIADFRQHLTQFTKVIEDMQKFLENNLKIIERRNSNISENNSEFETKLQALNAEYSELKNNYEVLTKQNTEFKSFIEFVNSYCNDSQTSKDLETSASIASLRLHFTQLLSKNQSLSDEIKTIQEKRKSEEDYCFWLMESLSEVELHLELLGRSPQTLNKVIEKLDKKLESIRQTLSQTYLESLNKTLLQIYKNHLKWFQFVNKPSKSTQTWIQSRLEDSSTEEEEFVSDGKRMSLLTNSENLTKEKKSEKNEISDEIKSKFDELSEEMAFDEFDIQSINYILMAKNFDYNLKSNLEVVEEVEEENIEDESETLSYEDNVFESEEELHEKCLKTEEKSENLFKNESSVEFIENIEEVVEQVLNEILDQINNQFVVNSAKKSSFDSNNQNIDSNVEDIQSSASTSRCGQRSVQNEDRFQEPELKPHNIDSDFVSDDLSSSPETVMTYQDNANIQGERNEHGYRHSQFLSTIEELKQLKSRQTSEVVSAKTRIHELKDIISEDKESVNGDKHPTKENQYLSDELKAWKEMVEQQKAIMEKIRTELELQQNLNNEKDRTIEFLKSQSKSESLTEICQKETSIHQNCDKSVDETSDDDNRTLMDELELNHLFDDNSVEDINEVIEKNKCLNEETYPSKPIDQRSSDIPIQEVWTDTCDHLDANYGSSGYSVYTDNSSPISVPEELLSTHRRKVFIPFSHEDAAVRRHSCQGRLTHYGDHPRKKRLSLKNAEIVFQQPKVTVRRIKASNKK